MTLIKNRLLLFISLSLMIFTLTPIGVDGQTNIGFPKFVEIEETYNGNANNDIYLSAGPQVQVIQPSVRVDSGDANPTWYFEETRDPDATINTGDTYTINNPGFYQFLNVSSTEQLSLSFNIQYYDLFNTDIQRLGDFDEDQPDEFDTVALDAGTPYSFSLDAEKDQPVALEFLASNVVSSSFQLGISVINPNGADFNDVFTINRNVKSFIPFVPRESGNHIITIISGEDVFLDGLTLNDDPEINEISSGYSETIEGDETVLKFFRLRLPSSDFKALEMNQVIQQYANATFNDFLGDLELRTYLPRDLDPLGGGLPGGLVISNEDIWFSVVATPLDEDDPSIQQKKEELNLPEGMDITYSFWTQEFNLDNLPTNVDFTTPDLTPYSDSTIYYTFNTDSPLILGFNTTGANFQDDNIDFYPLDPLEDTINIDDDSNDIINNNNHDLQLLPAGDYYVIASDNTEMRISTFTATGLNQGSSYSRTSTIDQHYFLSLPSSGFNTDLLNITYPDELNRSASYQMIVYDNEGNYIDNQPLNFENYTDEFDNPQVNTVETYSINHYNLRGLYLQFVVTANAQYNNTDGTLRYQNLNNISSTIVTTRLNQIDYDQTLNPNDVYFQKVLSGSDTLQLNAINDTIIAYYTFNSQADTVYRFNLDAINRSLVDIDFFEIHHDNPANAWFSFLQTTSQDINNQTHYISDFEFATTENMRMGLYIAFGPENFNGTFNINVQTLQFQTIADLELSSINEGGIEPPGGLFSNPLFYVGVAATLGIIGVLVYFFRQRGMGV